MKNKSSYYITSPPNNSSGLHINKVTNVINVQGFKKEGIILTDEELVLLGDLEYFHNDEEILLIMDGNKIIKEIRIGAIETALMDFLSEFENISKKLLPGVSMFMAENAKEIHLMESSELKNKGRVAMNLLSKLIPESKGKSFKIKKKIL